MKLCPRLLIVMLPALITCGTWNRDNPFDPKGTDIYPPGNRPFITSVVTADGQVTISWSAVKGADSYDLYYAPGYTIDKTTALEMVGMTSPATVVDLTDGMPYAFAVSAVDTTGVESRLSNGATAMPSALPVTLSIAAQPQSQSVVAGKSVTFSVMVTGTPPLRYQWYKDSTLIPGATSSSYLLANTRPADAGKYSVQVSNDYVSLKSAGVTLTVISATNTYVLTVVADTGGAITTPSSSPVIVQYGAATTITASPFPGYGFVYWTVTIGTAAIADANSDSTTVILASVNATVAAIFKPHLALDRGQ